MSDPSHLTAGAVINDRYVIESHIGSGGYSQVLAARDRQTDRDVALKVLHDDATDADPRAVARLRQEAEILKAVDHPNIVRIVDVGSFSGGQFLVMEHVDGIGLNEVIEQQGPLETARLVPLVRQLLHALHAAHTTDILHRDLKPDNILIVDDRGDESIKLVDFGVAKATAALNEEELDDAITLVKTRAGTFVGTPRYSAPEMVVGDPLSPATDLFCVGLIVYEALMNRPLITGRTESELLNELVFPKPFDLDDVPDPWPRVLGELLEKDPDRRIDSAAAAIGLLDELFPSFADDSVELVTEANSEVADAKTDELDALHPRFDDSDSATETEIDSPPDFESLDAAGESDDGQTREMSDRDVKRAISAHSPDDGDQIDDRAQNDQSDPPSPSPRNCVDVDRSYPDQTDSPADSPTTTGSSDDTSSITTGLLFIIIALAAFFVAGVVFVLLFG